MKESFINGTQSEEDRDTYLTALFQEKGDRERQERWQNILEKDYQVKRRFSQNRTSVSSRRWIWWAVAATVLLAIAIPALLQLSTPNWEQLTAAHLSQNEVFDPRISKGETQETIPLQAIEAYNQRNYTEALTLYQNRQGNLSEEDQYYVALSLLYSEQYGDAVNQLTTLQSTSLAEEVRWFLALAHLKNNNQAAAIPLLKAIQSEDWKYKEAQELLDNLSS